MGGWLRIIPFQELFSIVGAPLKNKREVTMGSQIPLALKPWLGNFVLDGGGLNSMQSKSTLGHLDRGRTHSILRGLLRVVGAAARHLIHVVRVRHHNSILMIIIVIIMVIKIILIIIMMMA